VREARLDQKVMEVLRNWIMAHSPGASKH
jgi:hypothetical protein